MSARSTALPLVERPKASSFTSASMSAGRRSKSRRSSCSSNGSARAQAVAALTPAQKASSASRSAGQGVRLLLRHASQAERTTVRGQPLGAGDLGEPAGDDAPVEVDLPEAILTVAEALPEP